MKRFLLPAAAALALAACGPHDSSGRDHAAVRGGTLTVPWSADVDSIDAGQTYYSGGYMVTAATQRTPIAYAPGHLDARPDLATAMPKVSADGRTVTVRLRAGVHFSPPVRREVTAADVKYAIERGFFKTVNNPYAGAYFGDLVGAKPGAKPGSRIAGIQTPDAHTLVFHLSKPTGGARAPAPVAPPPPPAPPPAPTP